MVRTNISLNPGMRSKWSEDEEDKVKISAGNATKRAPKNDMQEFPYPNAVEPKEGKSFFYSLF